MGEMTWVDGTRFIGEWKADVQNGKGLLIFPDGTKKEGIFTNNILTIEYINGKPPQEPSI